jgi:hypothetical protein
VRKVVSVFAIALSGVALLPALFLATYDHQGGSPIEGGQLLQLAVVAVSLGLAIWGHLNRHIAATLASFVLVIGWVPLVLALAD